MALELDRLDLTHWLSLQSIYPKVYIKDRDTQEEIAALGNVLNFSHLPNFEDLPDDVRLFGGMHFPSTKQDTLWNDFPHCAFWLPACEIVQDREKTLLKRGALQFENRERPTPEAALVRMQDSISLEEWEEQIAHLFEDKDLEKLVLGRKKTLTFSHPLCPWTIIDRLKERAQNATLFVFQLTPHTAFLGATPEKLFHRQKDRLTIDAVAGTRKIGQAESELKENPKELSEFLFVKDYIHRSLLPFAESIQWKETDQILKTALVQHLYNQATVKLKNGVTDRALIEALHPTPAVGGVSKEKAIHLLSEIESFQRGWYAAPVGWISATETNLSVAIRSALLCDRMLHVFAAAGIVRTSIAKNEWEEIDHKMRLMLYGCGLA